MSAQVNLKAPFPYFGGKSTVASEVWKRFGTPRNYVEPFFGSGAMLLCNKRPCPTETVNDKNAFLCNFWRAVKFAPELVASHADNPINEADFHARHFWLNARAESLQDELLVDPHYFDAQAAGWYGWGMAWVIGGAWCVGNGPWVVEDGQVIKRTGSGGAKRKMPALASANRGNLSVENFQALAARLAPVRVLCGSWERVLNGSVTTSHGLTAVFLDPPYSVGDQDVYREKGAEISADVRTWCLENGPDPLMRIALCGYEGEGHEVLVSLGWREWKWKARGGYGSQGESNENAKRERIWFSPHCLNDGEQLSLWECAE